jgi:hypothetical protein
MSVVTVIVSGLYTRAVAYADGETIYGREKERLDAAALRFAARKLVHTGEACGAAVTLLEQMAVELDSGHDCDTDPSDTVRIHLRQTP